MAKNNAAIYDISSLISAGIDPKTKLPIKFTSGNPENLSNEIRKTLRILDEQNAVNRYVWYNLPDGLDGQLVERILYYRGQAMFFYNEEEDKFYFLPYALSSEKESPLDFYGRFKQVRPIPFNGATDTKEDKKASYLAYFIKDVVYDAFVDDLDPVKSCVLLHDYTKQISQTIIPRQALQEPILGAMAEAFPMARTSLLANSGIKGMRVETQDEQSNVVAASKSIQNAALTGDPWIPIVGHVEFQDLTSAGSAIKSEEYLLYLQALDNFRLSLYGLKNGGLFQKKSHMLEAEEEMNDGNVGLVYQDGLTIRQNFCDMVNAIWGLGIWCEESMQVVGLGMGADEPMQDEALATNEEETENVE